jgi:hypothetical protein
MNSPYSEDDVVDTQRLMYRPEPVIKWDPDPLGNTYAAEPGPEVVGFTGQELTIPTADEAPPTIMFPEADLNREPPNVHGSVVKVNAKPKRKKGLYTRDEWQLLFGVIVASFIGCAIPLGIWAWLNWPL